MFNDLQKLWAISFKQSLLKFESIINLVFTKEVKTENWKKSDKIWTKNKTRS